MHVLLQQALFAGIKRKL